MFNNEKIKEFNSLNSKKAEFLKRLNNINFLIKRWDWQLNELKKERYSVVKDLNDIELKLKSFC